MTLFRTSVLTLLALCFPAAATFADELKPAEFRGDVTLKASYKYLISLPDGYESSPDKKWPLLMFLHGAGERGDNLELLKKHGPPKLIAAGKKFEAIVVCPQVQVDNVWDEHGVKALADDLVRQYRVDTGRLYLTGISMGGFGTWATALAYPDTWAAISPICGGSGVGFLLSKRIAKVPCWIFHGDKDAAVPVEYSIKMHQSLQKAGSEAKFTIYPGVGHDSWTRTYDNPEFWEWMFAQKK